VSEATGKHDAGTPASAAAPRFEWRAHPARERPLAALLAVAVIVAFGWAVYLFSQQRLWAIGSSVVLCLALARFFFGCRYVLDQTGITQITTFTRRRLRWENVRRVEVGSLGAWLSPSARRNWREGRRGVHVLFGGQREQVLAHLRRALESHGRGGLWPADCDPDPGKVETPVRSQG